MSQSSLKVNELYHFADESQLEEEVFDESALKEEEPITEDDDVELAKNVNQRVLDATQLYLSEIGFSPLLTAEEEVFLPDVLMRGYSITSTND